MSSSESRLAKAAAIAQHGGRVLPSVEVAHYNAELRDAEGFIGDRASNRAFRAILEDWRERLRAIGDDPLGECPSDEISKKKLDKVLVEGDPEAAGVIHGAIEDFAKELATVTGRLLRLKGWRDVQRIVVGGGLRASRVGELAIGRASVLLKAAGHPVEMRPIHHHPDEAGLVGALHLVPSWVLAGYDAVLAVDIGGSNIRCGVVEARVKKARDLGAAGVAFSELWRHADEKPSPTRGEAVARLVAMLEVLAKRARKAGLKVAPFVGVACPGVIEDDGSIDRGGQNLPGNWESSRFHLPSEIVAALPTIDGHAAHVVMHNDAVVQGLSEIPFTSDVGSWGVLTIGTGLGNAAFVNRAPVAVEEVEEEAAPETESEPASV